MKRVYFYKVYVCYTGYVYDIANTKFREYLISAAENLKDSSYSTRIEYLSDKDSHNVDGHYNFSKVIDENNLAIVSWAEIDKDFSLDQIRNDIKTEINYHKNFSGNGPKSFEYLLELLNHINL